MGVNELYFMTSGIAYIRGLDCFSEAISLDRFSKLYRAYLETRGFKWVESHFINTIIAIAGRYHRECGLFPPTCCVDCKYRITPKPLDLQRNALRVEFMSPSQRCGWNLKDGRLGGVWDDYHICTFPKA